jgi:1-acyl-sn-glycerol-3-phosphate acyltransferase
MSDFRPPLENPLFLAACHLFLPAELWRARIEVRIVGDGLQKLRALKGKRSAIVSNHGDQYDPEIVFTVADRLGEDFHFIAARECFDWVHGSVGWMFQNMGCYSVSRGEADIESFKMTREILVHGKRKLVMFPEGEVTRQPDLVLPLRRGAIRLFFEGQEALKKERPGEPLLLQPIGIRWRFRDDITPVLHAAIGKVEKQLRIVPPSRHLLDRVEYAAMTMAQILEEEYSAPERPDLPFEQRVIALRDYVLRSMALALNVELQDEEEHLVWFRQLNIALNQFVNADMSDRSAFQKRLHGELADKVERMRKDLIRMQHLIGITDDAPNRPITPERLANKVAKIEREVLGAQTYKGVRLAMVGVGEPISLLEYLDEYESHRDAAVDKMTERVHDAMQSIVDELDPSRQKGYAAFLPK